VGKQAAAGRVLIGWAAPAVWHPARNLSPAFVSKLWPAGAALPVPVPALCWCAGRWRLIFGGFWAQRSRAAPLQMQIPA
jgi:hypothetical protein